MQFLKKSKNHFVVSQKIEVLIWNPFLLTKIDFYKQIMGIQAFKNYFVFHLHTYTIYFKVLAVYV